ncbi:MAG TPA: hypothetical protein VGB04_07760 [Allosphingosinicella sp.]
MKTIEIDVEVNAAIENGRKSFKEGANDILRRLLLERSPEEATIGVRQRQTGSRNVFFDPPSNPGERITGRWTVQVEGRTVPAPSLKAAYRSLLLLLHERDPNFLTAFSKEAARARRFVARDPEALYLASPKLAKEHAKPLADGWHFDTNLSTDQVARRARIAARLAGLKYGKDVRVLNNFEEI